MRNRAFHVLFGPSTRFSVAFQCQQDNRRDGRGESSVKTTNNNNGQHICVIRQTSAAELIIIQIADHSAH